MLIRTRTIEYEAICLKQPIVLPEVEISGGDMYLNQTAESKAKPGDWLLITGDGVLSVVTDKALRDGSRFEIPDEASSMAKLPTRQKATPPKQKPTAPKKSAPKPAAAGRGRMPNVLRAERMAEAKRLIESGKSIQEAVTAIGVPYGTVYAWAKANGWGA